MTDFITQLAERALGVASVVQPVITPMFAPEPNSPPTDFAWDADAATPPDDLDQALVPSPKEKPLDQEAEETSLNQDVPEQATGEDTVMARREERSASINATPPDSGASDISPELHRPGGSTPSERKLPDTPEAMPSTPEAGSSGGETRHEQEDQQDLSSTLPGPLPRTPESRSVSSRLNESDSSRHSTASGKDEQSLPRVLTRRPQEPGQAAFRHTRTLVDGGQDATPPRGPSPRSQAAVYTSEGTLVPLAIWKRSAQPGTLPPAERAVFPRLDAYAGKDRQEPPVAVPESPAPPTIRVDIGRVEVRAIMPPPMPPARRTTPTRPEPALSLDDYLTQRNGGQR